MRTLLTFRCGDDRLAGVLDPAPSPDGLLVVSGGNEVAAGPRRAMARLASRVAAAGHPVFRYDRRGVGDSEGANGGWRSGGPDLMAALDCFARHGAARVVAFGNCDAATALALFQPPVAARVLANPWLDLESGDLPPPAAVRAHYARRLADPAAWRALLGGGVDLRRLFRGLRAAADRGEPGGLAAELAERLAGGAAPATIVLAERDNTGAAFADAWRRPVFAAARARVEVRTIPTDSHGFTRQADLDQLAALLVERLRLADATR